MSWKAVAGRNFGWVGTSLHLARFGEFGKMEEVENFTLTAKREGDQMGPPLLDGPEAVSFMQAVMDAAYEYGLRPSKATDSAGTVKHLEDMRAITKHLLKMDKPK
ncbi:hypothetical protein HGG71_05690 [Rhodobacteraceae bacterium R_SAG2]|nr:hypothetical protein [Rhodobacteraceae bacterium R_SAG2]